ncbi:Amidase signature domain [Sesbania bispinosa]|nr:Amidase signature domain [Sesbania bispinosa]
MYQKSASLFQNRETPVPLSSPTSPSRDCLRSPSSLLRPCRHPPSPSVYGRCAIASVPGPGCAVFTEIKNCNCKSSNFNMFGSAQILSDISIRLRQNLSIPDNKLLEYALQHIHEIGRSKAHHIVCELGVENKYVILKTWTSDSPFQIGPILLVNDPFTVKMRILMGTYALSAGYYDAYYKRAQQVNVNLAGLPALVLPCGFVEGGPVGLPVGLQMIGGALDEVFTFPIHCTGLLVDVASLCYL